MSALLNASVRNRSESDTETVKSEGGRQDGVSAAKQGEWQSRALLQN